EDDALEQVADEVPEVWLELLARLLVGLGDVDGHTPAKLFGLGLVAGLLTRFTKKAEHASKDVDVKIRDAHVGEAPLGDEVDGLQAAGAGDPDGRVRLLNRPRPGVDIGEVVVLRVPQKRPRLGPRLEDQVKRFAETLAGVRGVDAV